MKRTENFALALIFSCIWLTSQSLAQTPVRRVVVKAGRLLDVKSIVAVDGDPLSDVTTLQQVKFVMKGGEVVKNDYAH